MTKIKELQNESHLVPNKGNSEAPIRSLLWYFRNVNPKRNYSLSDLSEQKNDKKDNNYRYYLAEGKPRKNIATPDAVDKDLIHYKRPPKFRPDSPKVGYIYNITDRPTDHWNGSGFEHGVYSVCQ